MVSGRILGKALPLGPSAGHISWFCMLSVWVFLRIFIELLKIIFYTHNILSTFCAYIRGCVQDFFPLIQEFLRTGSCSRQILILGDVDPAQGLARIIAVDVCSNGINTFPGLEYDPHSALALNEGNYVLNYRFCFN